MASNQQWLNQIQVYNLLKFKNSGFKYWVEWPNMYCNNFIVVRNVVKRRTWLSWVDFDPYEERPEPPIQEALKSITLMKTEAKDKHEKHEEHSRAKNHGSSKRRAKHKAPEPKPVVESDSADTEEEQNH